MNASNRTAASLPDKEQKTVFVSRVSRRKPGLLHGLRAIEVEAVTPRMKKVCLVCEDVPQGRRLRVALGSGRSGKIRIYCRKCGVEALADWHCEYERAIEFLRNGKCRLGQKGPDGILLDHEDIRL